MTTDPTPEPPDPPPVETVEQRFRRLEAAWIADAEPLAWGSDLIKHPAFQEIISLGEAVVPLMLHDLWIRPGLWVWALPRITGANPVPLLDWGNLAKMSDAWLRWG